MPGSGVSISFTFELNEAGTRRRYGMLQTVVSANRGGLQHVRIIEQLPPRVGQPIDLERGKVG